MELDTEPVLSSMPVMERKEARQMITWPNSVLGAFKILPMSVPGTNCLHTDCGEVRDRRLSPLNEDLKTVICYYLCWPHFHCVQMGIVDVCITLLFYGASDRLTRFIHYINRKNTLENPTNYLGGL